MIDLRTLCRHEIETYYTCIPVRGDLFRDAMLAGKFPERKF